MEKKQKKKLMAPMKKKPMQKKPTKGVVVATALTSTRKTRGEMGPRGFAERERDMGPDQRREKQGARQGLEKGRLRRSYARLACIIRPQRLALNDALKGSPWGGPAWTTRARLDGCKTKRDT